jgi:hypothetical protein
MAWLIIEMSSRKTDTFFKHKPYIYYPLADEHSKKHTQGYLSVHYLIGN